ncbi:MAG: PilZ domain-containing protein [Sphingomicrobium sp.]
MRSQAVDKPTTAAVARSERRVVTMHGHIIRGEGQPLGVTLLDLSYAGCGIETPVKLEPGEALKLSVLGRGAIASHVAWYKDGKAGLNFDSEVEPARKRVARGNARVPLGADVTMRRHGHANFRVRVFDLSAKGCKVELIERPNEGEHVLVKFEALEVLEAVVCWITARTAGLEFARPIHPAVFDLLLERLK